MDKIMVIGARGKMDVEKALQKLRKFSSPSQIFDADIICGRDHVIAAYLHAKKSFDYGKNITRSMDMEILLYVSGKRQIDDAIKFAGAKDNGKYVFLFYGKSRKDAENFLHELGLKIDNTLLRTTIKKLKKFGVSEKELKTVSKSKYTDLVLEKMAMLDVMK